MPIVWTALITPFFANGDIDFNSLTTIVQQQETAGNGLLILGSTGEALALTEPEKRAVLKHVIALKPSVPIMVGVGGFQLPLQQEWMQFADSLGVDAFLLVTPIYAKPEVCGQTAWFEALLKTTQTPCMLYNIPSRAGVALAASVLNRLKAHNNLWAVKDSGGILQQLAAYQSENTKMELFCGNDDCLVDWVKHGAVGCVSVMSLLWPTEVQAYISELLKGKSDKHADAQWYKRGVATGQYGNPVTIKAALRDKEIIANAYCRPPLSGCAVDTMPSILQ